MIIVAPTRMDVYVLELDSPGKKMDIVMMKLKNIASPPMLGMILECTLRLLGLSVAPILCANLMTYGVKSIVSTTATIKAAIRYNISTLF